MPLMRFVNRVKSEKAFVFGFLVPLHYVLLFLVMIAVFYGLRSWINRDKWHTLVHEQYNFSIDYPANWKHNVYGERGSKNLHDLKAQIYTNSFGFLGPNSKAVWVYWLPMEKPTLEQAAERGLEKLTQSEIAISDLQETKIGTNNYAALTRTFQYTDSSEMSIYYYVIDDNGAYLLEFYLRNEADEEAAMPVFDQMLSSFHIIN